MAIKLSDVWKVGTTVPLPTDLTEAGSFAIDVVGKKLWFLDNLGGLFEIGGSDTTGTVVSVNSVLPDGGGNVVLAPVDIGAAPTTHAHIITDVTGLETELTGRYLKTEHVETSAGAPQAGLPIVLNASGRVDSSMLPTNNFQYQTDFTPAVPPDEYPDTTGKEFGAFWSVALVPEPTGYTFIGGDLIGRTVFNGDFMIWGVDGWGILQGDVDPNLYYKLDGTTAITAPFAGGGQLISNIADGVSATDAVALGQVSPLLALYLDLAGVGVMSGSLKMGSQKITGVAPAVALTDAPTLGQVEAKFTLGVY